MIESDLLVLPNGLEIASINGGETLQFYEEIFVEQLYTRGGVEIRPGDVVFDVGANIGMFTLFAHELGAARVYAFEPAAEPFAALEVNVRRHGVDARLFDVGLGREAGSRALAYYALSSGMSSFYGDRGEERAVLERIVENQLAANDELPGIARADLDFWLDEHTSAETEMCGVRTAADVIDEEGVERIDLLKVVVQKSEADVLAGVAEKQWPRIRQLVLEVYDLGGRLRRIADLLERRGFAVTVEQAPLFRGSIVYLVYGVRSGTGGNAAAART